MAGLMIVARSCDGFTMTSPDGLMMVDEQSSAVNRGSMTMMLSIDDRDGRP